LALLADLMPLHRPSKARTFGCEGERTVARELSDADKRRRVVLKRVNLDGAGVRSNFLKSGTMARGAAETGKVGSRSGSRLGLSSRTWQGKALVFEASRPDPDPHMWSALA
jgi:hypothetical protein